jgi:hypothetical protein
VEAVLRRASPEEEARKIVARAEAALDTEQATPVGLKPPSHLFTVANETPSFSASSAWVADLREGHKRRPRL